MRLDELNSLCAQTPCLLYQLEGPFALMSKARQSSLGLESGILIFRWPWEPIGTWSTFFTCAVWIMSHPVHKSFQDTKVSKNSKEPPGSVDCSKHYLLMMRHGLGIFANSRFGVVSIKASVSSVTGNSLHLEWGLVAVPPFLLESPQRVEFSRCTDLYICQKNSSRIIPCKENPWLKPPIRNTLDRCRATLEVAVDLGFPVSSTARNPMELVITIQLVVICSFIPDFLL